MSIDPELSRLQSESPNGGVREQSPRFDPFIGGHFIFDNSYSLGGVFLGYIIDRPHGRSAAQSLSGYKYDLTISHVRNVARDRPTF
jgi:hypothetical protein